MEHYFTNNEKLKSELRVIPYQYRGYSFAFTSDNGVFSKNKIDFGSRLLVETFLEQKKECTSILDVGCGYGFMGIVAAKFLHSKAVLVDINKRAIHLAKMNGSKNEVEIEAIESNIYEQVSGTFDAILTNPPIRAGKSVVVEILLKAQEHLKPNGELWFVIRKDQGAKSLEKLIKEIYTLEIVKKEKGFFIFRAKKN